MGLDRIFWIASAAVVGVAAGCASTGPTASTAPAPAPAPVKTVEARPVAISPDFTNTPAEADAQISSRAPGIRLYGELPVSGGPEAADASDNLRQVSFTREGADFDVDIDPTGKWIVFASTQHRTTADLYMKQVDGQTVTQLTTDIGNDVMPAISPDGKSIAYCSDRAGNWDIYVQPVDGGKAMQLTSDPAHEVHPSWSPDGKQLVFSCLGRQSGQWEMVVVDIDAPAKRRFLGFGLFPRFSPDGTKIVFQKARLRGTRTFSIWTIDYADGEANHPTEIAAATNAAVINPTWSPDGKRLAFATVVEPTSNTDGSDGTLGVRPQSAEIWAIDLDGSNRVKFTTDRFANLQPSWSRDGVIYFISNRTGFDNVWALRPTAVKAEVAAVKPAPAKHAAETQNAEVAPAEPVHKEAPHAEVPTP
jgi:TolB protein